MIKDKDNLIILKDLQGDVEYNNKAIYNIQEDARLILNVRIPELKASLVTINNNISSLSNTINSSQELNKERLNKIDNKVDSIRHDMTNIFWLFIVADTVLLISTFLFR